MDKDQKVVSVNVDNDKFHQLTALFVQAILTHPEREKYERAFYELFGPNEQSTYRMN